MYTGLQCFDGYKGDQGHSQERVPEEERSAEWEGIVYAFKCVLKNRSIYTHAY